jgi:hypothetical protein
MDPRFCLNQDQSMTDSKVNANVMTSMFSRVCGAGLIVKVRPSVQGTPRTSFGQLRPILPFKKRAAQSA